MKPSVFKGLLISMIIILKLNIVQAQKVDSLYRFLYGNYKEAGITDVCIDDNDNILYIEHERWCNICMCLTYRVILNNKLLLSGCSTIAIQHSALRVANDNSGNFYISGNFEHNFEPDTNHILFSMDLNHYLVKYNTNGDVIWAIATDAVTKSIAIDDSGYVYTTAADPYFSTYAGGTLFPLATLKIDQTGTIVWRDTVHVGKSIAAGKDRILIGGDSLICLTKDDSVLWTKASPANSVSHYNDLFIAGGDSVLNCIDISGNNIWQKSIRTDKLITKSNGKTYVIGDPLLSVIDTAGNLLWSRDQLPAPKLVDVYSDEKVYIIGSQCSEINWTFGGFYMHSWGYGGQGCQSRNEYYTLLEEDTLHLPAISVHQYYEDFMTYMNGTNPSTLCQGDPMLKYLSSGPELYGIEATAFDSFGVGNQFIHLLDDDVSFLSPDTIGVGLPGNAVIPLSFPAGIGYYKVISTNPVVESDIYQVNITPVLYPVVTPSGPTTFCLGDSITLTANYYCPNNCSGFTWYRNGSIFNETGELAIKVKKAGSYFGKYESFYNNDDGCLTLFPTIPVNVTTPCTQIKHHSPSTLKPTDGISEIENNTSIEVYPNPFYNNTDLYLGEGGSIKEVEIYSTDGRLIQKLSGFKNDQIKIGENLLPGIYYLHVKTLEGMEILPFVKM